MEPALGPTAVGGVASDDGTDVSNCRPHYKPGNFKSKITTARENVENCLSQARKRVNEQGSVLEKIPRLPSICVCSRECQWRDKFGVC